MCPIPEAAVGQQNALSLVNVNRGKFLNKLFNYGSKLKKDIKSLRRVQYSVCSCAKSPSKSEKTAVVRPEVWPNLSGLTHQRCMSCGHVASPVLTPLKTNLKP